MKLFLLAVAALALGGCASQSAQVGADRHTAHHPAASPAPAARYEQQMKMMDDTHRKMMAAKTPEERQALMAEHMKAMQGGMSMMCEMSSAGAGAGTQAGPPAGMMKRCMDMKEMTMKMMMDREAKKAPAK